MADRFWCEECEAFVEEGHRCEQWSKTIRIPGKAVLRLEKAPAKCPQCAALESELAHTILDAVSRLVETRYTAEARVKELESMIAKFCYGQEWADGRWKGQPHIMPLFNLYEKMKEDRANDHKS